MEPLLERQRLRRDNSSVLEQLRSERGRPLAKLLDVKIIEVRVLLRRHKKERENNGVRHPHDTLLHPLHDGHQTHAVDHRQHFRMAKQRGRCVAYRGVRLVLVHRDHCHSSKSFGDNASRGIRNSALVLLVVVDRNNRDLVGVLLHQVNNLGGSHVKAQADAPLVRVKTRHKARRHKVRIHAHTHLHERSASVGHRQERTNNRGI